MRLRLAADALGELAVGVLHGGRRAVQELRHSVKAVHGLLRAFVELLVRGVERSGCGIRDEPAPDQLADERLQLVQLADDVVLAGIEALGPWSWS